MDPIKPHHLPSELKLPEFSKEFVAFKIDDLKEDAPIVKKGDPNLMHQPLTDLPNPEMNKIATFIAVARPKNQK
jgi:hypothetical protein